MPMRKTPKRTLQARTSVTSRVSMMDSPDWKPATQFAFKTPKSPSPVKRTTRRSSMYKAAATTKTSRTSTFKMPSQQIISPPGVKTRARRSSIYHRGGTTLTSPPSSRTRRRSMYVSGKPGLQPMAEFSKVWATPVKPVLVESPEESKLSPVNSRSRKTPKEEKPATLPVKKTPARSKTPKTPKSPAKKEKKTPAKSPAVAQTKTSANVVIEKTPVASAASKKTPAKPKTKTPAKTPAKPAAIVKSPKVVKKTPARKVAAAQSKPSPKSKSPKSAVKSSTKKAKSAKSPVSSTPQKRQGTPANNLITSTPSKTLQEISGKSFYGTPSQTPIPLQRTDELFVFSAQPVKSAKRASVKRATILTPKVTPHKRNMKTPKKTPLRKTPATRKQARDDMEASTPAAKRVKTSPKVKSTEPKSLSPKSKAILTPSEMTSILRDVVETEREEERRASLSPSPRPRKLARLAGDAAGMSTPRVTKVAKRSSSRKLSEIQNINQSYNASVLDETINTDSRSGRCTLL